MEERLTILPYPCTRISGSTSWHMRTSPNTLVSNCLRTFSMGTASTAPDWLKPALLTSAPTAPSSRSTSPTAEAIESSSVTSRARSLQPLSPRGAIFSTSRAVAYTLQPTSERYLAVAHPMPEEQPVIRTAFETFIPYPPTVVNVILLGRPASWKMVWRATSVRDESNAPSPVLRLRSHRGWELEVISTLILCPGRNVMPVAHRSRTCS